MYDIPNPQETERDWLEVLERELQTYQSNINNACPVNRSLTTAEIRGILDYTQRVLQYFAQYSPMAAELTRLGFARLQRRLEFVRTDLGDALRIYTDMLGTTFEHQAYREKIQRDASTYVTRTMMESTLHSQQVFDRCTEMRNYVNHGMPFAWAEFLAKMPK